MKDDDDVEKNNPVLITYKDAKPILKQTQEEQTTTQDEPPKKLQPKTLHSLHRKNKSLSAKPKTFSKDKSKDNLVNSYLKRIISKDQSKSFEIGNDRLEDDELSQDKLNKSDIQISNRTSKESLSGKNVY